MQARVCGSFYASVGGNCIFFNVLSVSQFMVLSGDESLQTRQRS